MKDAETMKELESNIQNDIEKTLRRKVAPALEKILQKHIINDIYNKYKPEVYKRRDLLRSSDYLFSDVYHDVDGLTLFVTNITPGNTPSGYGQTPVGTELLEIIETGDYGSAWPDGFPRPAVANARPEAEEKALEILRAKYK